jgi:broad specificity phosphatase PhoE
VSSSEHRVILLRHGETAWSRERRHTGRTDIPLTEAGIQEARAAGSRLAGATVDHVLVSPLIRARDTCELAGFGAGAVVEPALVEWDYGEYEGRTSVEIRAERPGWSLWRDGCPGGEDAAAVAARVDPVVARCLELPASWLIVAHSHVLRVLTARWCGLGPEAGALLQLGTAAICVLAFEHDVPGLRRWNDDGTPL